MVLRIGHPSKKGRTDTSDARLDFRNQYVCNADGSPRGGVTSPVGAVLLSATATMNVTVGAFSAVTVRDGGIVEMANDGPTPVQLDNPPSSQSRIDVVYVKQNDSSSTVSAPDANDLPVFGVLKGNASATPVKRTDLPAGAEEIGTVLIPSTATATNSPGVVITTTCRYTAAAGGKVPFRTLADLQAWTNPQPGQDAQVFADGAGNGDYVWSGSTWSAVPRSGLVPIIPSSVAGSAAPSVDGNGKVAFTVAQSATGITVNGVFSAAFSRYKVLIHTFGVNDAGVGSGITNSDMFLHFSSGGVQNGGANYFGGSNGNAQTGWQLGTNGGHGRTLEWLVMDPFQAMTTKGAVTGATWDSASGAMTAITRGMGHSNPGASFDGFVIDFALPSGRAAGELQVFGFID